MKYFVLLLSLLSISCIAFAQQWGDWQTVYYGTVVEGEPYAGKVEISFKVRGCKGWPNSYYRLNNSISTQYSDLLEFRFEYLDCDGKTATEKVWVNLKEDTGLKEYIGFWFLGTKVTKIIDIKFTPGVGRRKNKTTNPTSNPSNDNPDSNNNSNDKGDAEQQAKAESARQLEQQQLELARQQELERQRRAAEAEAVRKQNNQYMQQAQDPNNTAITQAMYLNQAKLNTTYQQLQGNISAQEAQQQQTQIQQLQSQQLQENIQNTAVGVVNLFSQLSSNRQDRLAREARQREARQERERQEAIEEAQKTPEQRQREREEAERRRVEEEQRRAEAALKAEQAKQEYLRRLAFNLQLQYGFGFDNIPIIINDAYDQETSVYNTQQPVLHLGLQANIMDNKGVSFHLTPSFSYGENILTPGHGTHKTFGLDGMIHFSTSRQSACKFVLEGAYLKRSGDFKMGTGNTFSSPAGSQAAYYVSKYDYSIVRYGVGLLFDVNGGLSRRTFLKPGLFFERPSFFASTNKALMVGNLQILITNKLTIDLSYSTNYAIAGKTDYPANVKAGNQDFYSIRVFLKSTLIR
jgi:hypothetical protein